MFPGSSLANRRAASAALRYTKLVVSASASECSWKSLRIAPALTPRVSGLCSDGMGELSVDPGEPQVQLVAGQPRVGALAVAPPRLHALEVFRRHVAGHVDAVEARAVEPLDRGIQLAHVVDERFEILVDHGIGADESGDFLGGAPGRDELAPRGHVDAVDVG